MGRVYEISTGNRKKFTQRYLAVLNAYVNFERLPDPRRHEYEQPFCLWDKAMG